MAVTNTYATFIRHRQDDGSYIIMYPINTADEVYVDIDSKLSLTNKIKTMDATAAGDKESIVDDILTILSVVAPMYQRPLLLNHVYADDFANASASVNLAKGLTTSGKIFI